MGIMRKFYVRYEYNLGGPRYSNTIITLEENEKANMETFFKKLNKDYIRILSWSLIEEQIMSIEELYKLINESEWHPAPETKICNNLEYSEMFALWNDDISYLVYGVRDYRYPNKIEIPIMRGRPMLKFYTDISEVDIDCANINVMLAKDMCKDEKIHNDFLKRNK